MLENRFESRPREKAGTGGQFSSHRFGSVAQGRRVTIAGSWLVKRLKEKDKVECEKAFAKTKDRKEKQTAIEKTKHKGK